MALAHLLIIGHTDSLFVKNPEAPLGKQEWTTPEEVDESNQKVEAFLLDTGQLSYQVRDWLDRHRPAS